ncbi:hypothetical protein DPMN_070640 [Dreissena polymorpha]|uniref:Uncharacterized protein n=1 Tax=Dreissena polymorpha TaxID=45954 RepID=A0A9D4BV88_DREPO|nr:hypothetical protein DPMN_070640 [Dreissena polymorpha]
MDETMRDLKSPYLVGKLMELLDHNLLSLAIAAVARVFLFGPQLYWYHPWTEMRPST